MFEVSLDMFMESIYKWNNISSQFIIFYQFLSFFYFFCMDGYQLLSSYVTFGPRPGLRLYWAFFPLGSTTSRADSDVSIFGFGSEGCWWTHCGGLAVRFLFFSDFASLVPKSFKIFKFEVGENNGFSCG